MVMKPVRLLCYMFLWTWKCTTFKRIPIIWIVLTNKNVALIYSVTICQQKTKDCALSGCFQHKLQLRVLFLSLMFPTFHNQSPLITMIWSKIKFSQLILYTNVWRSVWRICMCIQDRGFKGWSSFTQQSHTHSGTHTVADFIIKRPCTVIGLFWLLVDFLELCQLI